MNLRHGLLVLLILQTLQSSSESRKTSQVSYCASAKPCEKVCPPSGSTKFKDSWSSPPSLQQMSSTVYCLMGRCFCPENRIATSKCSKATMKEKKACASSELNYIQGIPSMTSTIDKDKTISICKVKGRKNRCTGQQNKDRYYCVIPLKTNSTTGVTQIPGMPTMPSMPGTGTGMIPPVPNMPPGTGSKTSTGQSSTGTTGKGKT